MKRAVLTAVLLLMGLTLAAQTPTTLRVDVRLVNVVATVTDAGGKSFRISPRTISRFSRMAFPKKSPISLRIDVPVSVGILLDTSGSMQGKMSAATSAVERFINNVHADDDIFLMTFARDITIEQDFTSDRRKLARALNSLNVSGGTASMTHCRKASTRSEEDVMTSAPSS